MQSKKRTLSRGAYPREGCVFIGAWVPSAWIKSLDALVIKEDLDRSKLLRQALKEKLEPEPEAA